MTQELVRVELPDTGKLMASADAAVQVASMSIDCAEVADLAAEELRAIVTRKKELTEMRMEITRPIDQSKARVMDLFKPVIARLEQAEAMIKSSLSDYNRRLQIAQAEKQAAIDAAAAAERKRLEAEAQAESDKGNTEAAAALREFSSMVVAPAAAPAAAKPEGVSFRSGVEVEVDSVEQLVKHIAANPDLTNLVKPDLTAIKAYIKATGRALPGVVVREKQIVAARRAA
jgi:hypothetical protein